MKITLLNNEGSGFHGQIELSEGTTLQALFDEEAEGESMSAYTIRVNRSDVHPSYVLQDGDKVTFTPANIQGA